MYEVRFFFRERERENDKKEKQDIACLPQTMLGILAHAQMSWMHYGYIR